MAATPDTPAAMIQMAFWHGEKVVTGTLATIAAEVERAGISPPATLVVGEAVRLREKLKQSERDLAPTAGSQSAFRSGACARPVASHGHGRDGKPGAAIRAGGLALRPVWTSGERLVSWRTGSA